MKIVFAMMMAIGLSASAQACSEGQAQYWPSNNPALVGSEGGAQDVLWTCVNGKYVEEYAAPAPQYRSCVEGDIQNFPVADSRNGGESGTVDASFVCHNGKYSPVNAGAKRARRAGRGYVCKNGSEMYFEENSSNAGGESGTVQVLYTCKNGRFVKKYAR